MHACSNYFQRQREAPTVHYFQPAEVVAKLVLRPLLLISGVKKKHKVFAAIYKLFCLRSQFVLLGRRELKAAAFDA